MDECLKACSSHSIPLKANWWWLLQLKSWLKCIEARKSADEPRSTNRLSMWSELVFCIMSSHSMRHKVSRSTKHLMTCRIFHHQMKPKAKNFRSLNPNHKSLNLLFPSPRMMIDHSLRLESRTKIRWNRRITRRNIHERDPAILISINRINPTRRNPIINSHSQSRNKALLT